MANFKEYFPIVLQHEGGFVEHPDNPGGATNKGITLQTFKLYAERELGIAATVGNLKSLSFEQAFHIYKKRYWDKIKGDSIRNQMLANLLFDFYVNAGTHSTKLLQQEINTFENTLKVDGVVGTRTISAMNAAPQAALYNAFKIGRKGYYIGLAERVPRLQVFLKSWLKRVNSFPDMAEVVNN